MKIGLISDTHDYLPEQVFNVFSDVDVILHAGDIVNMDILEKLRMIAPVEAVYGNSDMYSTARILPSRLNLKYVGLCIFMTHNIGGISQFMWKIKKNQILPKPDIVIFGHTHIPSFEEHDGITFINPGSSGKARMGGLPTVKIMKLKDRKIDSVELITLHK